MVQLSESHYGISVWSGRDPNGNPFMAFYTVEYDGYIVAAGGPYDTETEAQREAEIAMRDHAAIRLAHP